MAKLWKYFGLVLGIIGILSLIAPFLYWLSFTPYAYRNWNENSEEIAYSGKHFNYGDFFSYFLSFLWLPSLEIFVLEILTVILGFYIFHSEKRKKLPHI